MLTETDHNSCMFMTSKQQQYIPPGDTETFLTRLVDNIMQTGHVI